MQHSSQNVTGMERKLSIAGGLGLLACGKPVQRVEDRLDQRTDVGSRDSIVADMRGDDLGGESQDLAPVDALVLGHACGPLLAADHSRSREVVGPHLPLQMLRRAIVVVLRPDKSTEAERSTCAIDCR